MSSRKTAVTLTPSIAVTRSFGSRPAARAGPCGSVPATMTPSVAAKAVSFSKSRSGCQSIPNHAQWALPYVRRFGSTSRTIGEGMVKPCAPCVLPRALRPTTSPCVSTSGPPELPGEIAASVWYQSV